MMGIGGGSYHNVLWCIIVGSNWPSFKLVFIVWGFLEHQYIILLEFLSLADVTTDFVLIFRIAYPTFAAVVFFYSI